jgi:hypothetical protein
MNERSFIVKSDMSHFPYVEANAWVLEDTCWGSTSRTPRYAESFGTRHSATPLSYLKCLSVQDFVCHTGCAVCETTGTGCAAGSNPANGSGVGCPTNWKIAVTTLKMHVAYTAVSIAPRPFSSEPARIPYNV